MDSLITFFFSIWSVHSHPLESKHVFLPSVSSYAKFVLLILLNWGFCMIYDLFLTVHRLYSTPIGPLSIFSCPRALRTGQLARARDSFAAQRSHSARVGKKKIRKDCRDISYVTTPIVGSSSVPTRTMTSYTQHMIWRLPSSG